MKFFPRYSFMTFLFTANVIGLILAANLTWRDCEPVIDVERKYLAAFEKARTQSLGWPMAYDRQVYEPEGFDYLWMCCDPLDPHSTIVAVLTWDDDASRASPIMVNAGIGMLLTLALTTMSGVIVRHDETMSATDYSITS